MATLSTKEYSSSWSTLKFRHFKPRKQLAHLLLTSLSRWLLTVALCISIYGVIWSYSDRDAMPQRQKKIFNTIIIALTVSLSLNIASTLKAHVSELRWWMLSLYEYTPRETDLILQSEHISRLIILGWTSRRLWVQVFVLVTLLLNIASQVALALLGITYNIIPSDTFTITKPGLVAIPDLSDIQANTILSKQHNGTQELNARRYSANNYGIIGQSYMEAPSEFIPKPGTVYNPDDPQVFYNNDTDMYRYIFYEASLPNATYWNMVATNRSVSTYAKCTSCPVTEGGSGLNQTIIVRCDNVNTSYTLPALYGPDQTLFLHDPISTWNSTSGQLFAFEASLTSAWFYFCNASIGQVVNAVIEEQRMGPNLTQFVSPAIALRGYGGSSVGATSDGNVYQFQSYPSQSYFGSPVDGNADSMGYQVARFAINVVAAAAQSNTNVNATGRVPLKAIRLNVDKWVDVHIILCLTAGVQLLVALVSVAIANSVQVRSHSCLAMAALLRSPLQTVSSRASMASGRQVANMMGHETRMQYLPDGRGGYDIGIIRAGSNLPR